MTLDWINYTVKVTVNWRNFFFPVRESNSALVLESRSLNHLTKPVLKNSDTEN